MFGHQDDQSAPVDPTQMQHDNSVMPSADGAMSIPAPQSDGPAGDDNQPLATAQSETLPGSYIATDQHGQPDATGDLAASAPGTDDLLNIKQQA